MRRAAQCSSLRSFADQKIIWRVCKLQHTTTGCRASFFCYFSATSPFIHCRSHFSLSQRAMLQCHSTRIIYFVRCSWCALCTHSHSDDNVVKMNAGKKDHLDGGTRLRLIACHAKKTLCDGKYNNHYYIKIENYALVGVFWSTTNCFFSALSFRWSGNRAHLVHSNFSR